MTKEIFCREIQMPFGYLDIESCNEEYLVKRVIENSNYKKKFASDRFAISFGIDFNYIKNTYRQEMLEKGIYLGHHVGQPIKMMFNEQKLMFIAKNIDFFDYDKLFWNFALKYALTVMSLKWEALHLKASTLFRDNKAILLLGRGGSGKTTLSKYLECKGYFQGGNTHAIVKDNYAWAINTWIRQRDEHNIQTCSIKNLENSRDAEIKNVFIVDYNNEGEFISKYLQKDVAKAFITYFSASIGNYDLKEDIFDYNLDKKFTKKVNLLVKEQNLIDNLVINNKIYYLSYDIKSSNSCMNLEKYLEGIDL